MGMLPSTSDTNGQIGKLESGTDDSSSTVIEYPWISYMRIYQVLEVCSKFVFLRRNLRIRNNFSLYSLFPMFSMLKIWSIFSSNINKQAESVWFLPGSVLLIVSAWCFPLLYASRMNWFGFGPETTQPRTPMVSQIQDR